MSVAHDSEHWFDRAAGRLTRRRALKAGLAGAALTFPLLRSTAARADFITVGACFVACRTKTHQDFLADTDYCLKDVPIQFHAASYLWTTNLGLFGLAGITIAERAGRQNCQDQAMADQKAAMFDCAHTADCSGFDPTYKGGPCENCGGNNCCYCPDTPFGEICCFFQCDDPDHNCCGS